MSYQENGIFSRYLNIKPNRKIKDVLNNSCYVNLIVKKFQTAFLNSKYKFELKAESLCQLCGIEYKNANIGLSFRKSIAFFEKFKLGLCVYGPFGCLFKYKPMRRNKNINTSCLYMYIHNNHCYEINDNVKNFERVVWEGDENINTELTSITVSNNYNIRSQTTNLTTMTKRS